ncbi:MAG TPA: hypothetical protein VJ860_04355 [Polyangia bacterium]|nr:hypothetical protein [Polyangia bacterium]
MKTLGVIVLNEFLDQVAQMVLTENDELTKLCQDGRRLHNLAALPSFFRAQLFSGKRETTTLVRRERNSLLARHGPECPLQDPILLQRVVQPWPHPLVDRRREHGDDKLERQRQHRSQPARLDLPIQAANPREFMRESWR